ncbi:MAG TPA: hypothetical protein VJM09_13645, partial [Sphingobium sp.]|nr:hypothetical protein [Sphingobium sp.]
EYHLLVLPATTVAMLGAALVCCRRRTPGASGFHRLGRWPFEVAATYAAMMALMAAGAAAAANMIGNQTHAVLGGAVLANVLFPVALGVFRRLAAMPRLGAPSSRGLRLHDEHPRGFQGMRSGPPSP